MSSFGVKNNKEVTFAFLRTFGIGEVRVVPAYIFSTSKNHTFFKSLNIIFQMPKHGSK